MGKEYKKTPKNSKKTFPFQNKKTKQKIICAKETINAIANKKNKKSTTRLVVFGELIRLMVGSMRETNGKTKKQENKWKITN